MRILLLTLFLTITLFAYAQKVKVFDRRGLHPIEDVYIYSSGHTAFTDVRGEADVSAFKGAAEIVFKHPYYRTETWTYYDLEKRRFRVRLEEDPVKIDEIVISASKREQKRSEVAARIASITIEDAEFFNVQTTADLVGTNSEVFVQKSQLGGGSPMLRGFSANRILLVVDGVRMNNAIYRSGNLQNVLSLDAHALHKSEIIFGPSSVIYGSDALGGVLNFQTLAPKLTTSGTIFPVNVTTRYATANKEKTAHLDINYGATQWALVTSVSFSDYEDQRMGSRRHNDYLRPQYVVNENGIDRVVNNPDAEIQRFSGFSQLNVMQKVRFMPHEKLDMVYAFHFSRTSDIPRYDRLIQYSGETPKYAEWYYGPQQWMMHHLQATIKQPVPLYDRVSFNAAYQDYTESRHDRKFEQETIRERTENVDLFSLNIDFDKKMDDTRMLYYGLEYLYNKVHSEGQQRDIATGSIEEYASRYPDGTSYSSVALYGSYKNTLSEKLTLHAGARYSYVWSRGEFDQRFYDFQFDGYKITNGALTANLGVVYHPSQEWQLNLNTSTGFRAPNVDDAAKVFDSEPGVVVVPNPSLKSEYAVNMEAAIIRNFSSNARLEFSAYYTHLYNAMVRRDFTFNGQDSILYDGVMSKVKALTNADHARIYGFSVGFTGAITDILTFKSNLSWQYGRDSEEMPVRHVAPLFGGTHLLLNVKQVKFDFYALYNGAVAYKNLAPDERDKTHMYAIDEEGDPYSPSWITLNLKSSFQLNKTAQLNLGMENILDVRYRPYSSGIVAPGRNLIVSLRVRL